jgi:hypothetical protein
MLVSWLFEMEQVPMAKVLGVLTRYDFPLPNLIV